MMFLPNIFMDSIEKDFLRREYVKFWFIRQMPGYTKMLSKAGMVKILNKL